MSDKAKLLLLLHDDKSTPGTTTAWCDSRGVAFEIRNAAKFSLLNHPRAADYRGLIVFGGNMEAWEEDKHPWLRREKSLLCDFVHGGKGVFGICLGTQLLASCLGGRAYPLCEWRIGWGPCSLEGGAGALTPLHWHSSTFQLPEGAELLAWDATGLKLGFALSPRVLGYQFHTEINPERLEEALKNWKPELKGRVDEPAEIRAGAERSMPALREWYFAELDRWWAALA